jgi:hypothetical protein
VYDYKYDDYRAEYDQLWNEGWRLEMLRSY